MKHEKKRAVKDLRFWPGQLNGWSSIKSDEEDCSSESEFNFKHVVPISYQSRDLEHSDECKTNFRREVPTADTKLTVIKIQ